MPTPLPPVAPGAPSLTFKFRTFLLIAVGIIALATLRSAIATRLDSFTLDEGYHIVAGVSYVQRGDFRINPEHPPLVKLWVGSIISALGFHLSPFREVNDKSGERAFTDANVWTQENNPYALQHHARIAMWIFNGILLLVFSLALRRVFGPIVALATLLFLAVDPTVAAHLPIVMTDLPVALLSATAVVMAARAFRTWRWPDLAACAIALGFTLGAKHSAPVFCIILALAGLAFTFLVPLTGPRDSRWLRCTKVSALLLAAVIILWGFYRFRFTESTSPQEVFNRPPAGKVADLQSPAYRFALTHLASWHLLPRAYIWGLADTVRAGLEGRLESRLVWGRPFLKAPWYFFPSVVLVKLPLGLLLLILLGLFLFFARRLPDQLKLSAMLLVFAVLCFFFVLLRGSDYGGMRHALPVVLLLSIFEGFAVQAALASSGKALKILVAVGFTAAAVSALPAVRPWEYFNELVGGAGNAYLYFNDEGVDVYQRHHEIVRYYHDVVKPTGEIPFIEYLPYDLEAKFRGLDWVGRDMARDEHNYRSPIFTGTIMVEGRSIGPRLFSDWAALRAAKPVARFGNFFVYRGTYNIGPLLSDERYYRGTYALFAERPDLVAAERLFRQSIDLYPKAFWSFIELGNIYISRGSRAEAVQAYTSARDTIPAGSVFLPPIENQLRVLASNTPLSQILPVRDPRWNDLKPAADLCIIRMANS